jgi:cyclophilin family peptidyl-prolyl cis-trans isomerase
MLCRFMHRFVSWLVLLVLATPALWAQSTVPTLSQPLPNQAVALGASAITVDLRNYFTIPGVTGQVAQFDTVLGKINVELLANDAPLNVANFLNYVNRGAYTNTFIQRSVAGFVIQGGGYFLQGNSISAIAADAPVKNEFKDSNLRGTMAMAKTAAGPDTATNQWFFNLADNSANLDNQNGGFTVFARVIGTGMTVVDAIAAVTTYNETTVLGADFSQLPLLTGNLTAADLVLIRSITTVPIYPTSGASTSVLSFAGQSFNSTIASVTFNQSNLVITPSSTATGTATISVTASDTNGNVITGSFTVTVAASVTAPIITTPPASQYVPPGSNVTFSVVASGTPPLTYQWKLSGTAIAGATGATYAVANVQAANMGFYSVTVTNGVGSVDSDVAILTLAAGSSRLGSLSTRGIAGAGASALTPGISLRGVGNKPLVIRGVGPTLGAPPSSGGFGVPNTLSDPQLQVIPLGGSTPVASNDDWGTNLNLAALRAAMTAVGAFPLIEGSKDAAVLVTTTGNNLYTVPITPSGAATPGIALAEIYDTEGATAPVKLVAVSTRGFTGPNEQVLTPGFFIVGDGPKQLLIRAVGPTLGAAPYNVPGVLADPQFTVIPLGMNFAVASNDNWGDTTALKTAFTQTGAFALLAGSKDAAAIVRLPPGGYTVQATGVGGTTGNVLVEVYDMDP